MPFPRASQALSRFTVLDLTRVRSGPTCVRQLADWGANVIKIDALLEDAAGEQPGGPRQGSDFQNLHRNKRAMTLNLKDPRGLEVFRTPAAGPPCCLGSATGFGRVCSPVLRDPSGRCRPAEPSQLSKILKKW